MGVYRKVDLLQDCGFAAHHLVYGLGRASNIYFYPTIVCTMLNASLSEGWQGLIHCGFLQIVISSFFWTHLPAQFFNYTHVSKRKKSSKEKPSVCEYRLCGRKKVKMKPPPTIIAVSSPGLPAASLPADRLASC